MVPVGKYSGAGNDFLVIDGRGRDVSEYRRAERISALCDRLSGLYGGADGLMMLSEGRDGSDFTMEYYNSDGSGGMMCGNGGRCIAAFAIAAWAASGRRGAEVSFEVRARRDTLHVGFSAGEAGTGIIARNITLTGPTEKLC